MPLIEQSLWWLLPGVVLILFMSLAMMELTASLLVREPRWRGRPAAPEELRRRLTELGGEQAAYRVVEAPDGSLELRWQVVDATWYELFAQVKLTAVYRARMALDEERRELRWYESIRSSSFFLGFQHGRPRFNASFTYRGGYVDMLWAGRAYGILPGFPPRIGRAYDFRINTVEVKDQVRRVVREAGWTFRPVVWPFLLSARASRRLGQLMPPGLRSVPRRQLWGVLYPLSYVLGIGYLALILGPLDRQAWLAIGLVSAGWWGVWGLVTWLLVRRSRG